MRQRLVEKSVELCYEWAKEEPDFQIRYCFRSGAGACRPVRVVTQCLINPVWIFRKTNCDTEMVLWIPDQSEALSRLRIILIPGA